MRAFVTGGAGFIGSHIVDKLIEMEYEVIVYDNLVTGRIDYLKEHIYSKKVNFIRADLLDFETLKKSISDCDIVFHIAANADVRGGIKNTKIDFEQNIIATYNVLEAMRLNNIKKIVFSSSAAIYGEPKIFPTPEDYFPIQTSLYGASKLAAESLIEAYCEGFNFQAWIFRFVSLMGERYSHGVAFDFVKKISKNRDELEILGNGMQKKSYLCVDDAIDAIFIAIKKANKKVNIFNLGNLEYCNVIKVADIITEEIGLKNVKYKYTGGIRGWVGDSPFVFLDTNKIQKLGWKPKLTNKDCIKKTVRYLLEHKEILNRE